MPAVVFWVVLSSYAWGQWSPQVSGSSASLRAVSAVNASIVWASGSGGAVLRTSDGGSTWRTLKVPDSSALDFRAIRAFDGDVAVLMSAGTGKASRVYKTWDRGGQWKVVLQNDAPAGFFDAIAFWDTQRGLVMGDPVDGRLFVSLTSDGGSSWQRIGVDRMPVARQGEGAFAASGTCLVVAPGGLAWIATGGTGGGRVYRSTDWGQSWEVAETPVRHDDTSSGIFSLAFHDGRRGVAVGGNYSKPAEDKNNIAFTTDGGATWTAGNAGRPGGYRSAAAYLPGSLQLIVTGTTGTDRSSDAGRTWIHLGDEPYNAMSFVDEHNGWAAGPKGAIGKFAPSR